MKRIELDGRNISDVEGFYREFRLAAAVPEYFGNNLDALWDFLTVDLPAGSEIVWNGFGNYSADALSRLEPVTSLLRDAMAERSDLSVIFADSDSGFSGGALPPRH